MAWKQISSVERYRNRYMRVTEDILVTDHGDQVTYGIVHKEPAVLVIPYDGTSFTLIGQYRFVVDHFSWEFPAGHFEHDSLEEAARAELEEETGCTADSLEVIGTFNIAPGHNTQVCHVFLARGLGQGTQKLEPSEKGMQVRKVTESEITDMIRKGEIKDGLTIAGFQIFQIYSSRQ